MTHPALFHPAASVEDVLANLKSLFNSPSLVLLSETPAHASILERALIDAGARGNLVHDVHIAALCFEHGVSELLTADRDFMRFTGLTVTNPFAERAR